MCLRTGPTPSRPGPEPRVRRPRAVIVSAAMTARHQRGPAIWRAAQLGLMPVAALAVHQLRYWLAFGGRAGTALQLQGHSYLHSLAPWVVAVLALSVGIFLRALGRAFGGGASVSRLAISFVGLWLLCALALMAVYSAQELLEGLFATGHPAGLTGVLGYGGCWSIPASLAVGLVLAAVFHGTTWVIEEVAARHSASMPGPPQRPTPRRVPRDIFMLGPAPMAEGWSGRGPPA